MTEAREASGPAAPADGSDGGGGDPVRIQVYSDYTCPWCYIGWARLERMKSELPGRISLDVRWMPFEIHPEVPEDGMPVEELGYPEERWRRMQEALRRHAADEGLELGNRPKVSNTHQALAAGSYAQEEEPEHFPAFHEALFRSYFSEGRDLGGRSVILDVAREAGLDADALEVALDQGRYDDELAKTGAMARERGISGTPTFVFDDRYAAPGAQPAETLRRMVERIVAEGR